MTAEELADMLICALQNARIVPQGLLTNQGVIDPPQVRALAVPVMLDAGLREVWAVVEAARADIENTSGITMVPLREAFAALDAKLAVKP